MKYLFDEYEAVCLIETYIINYYEKDTRIKRQNIELLSKKLNLYGRYRYADRIFDDKYRNVNGMDLQLKIVVTKLVGKYRGFKHSKIIEENIETLLLNTNYFIEKLEKFYQYDYSSIGINNDYVAKNKELIYKFVKENNKDMNEEKRIIWDENTFDIPFSRPTKLIFEQKEIKFNNSWRALYRELICFLLKNQNYRNKLLYYKDTKFFGSRRALFNSYDIAVQELKNFNASINEEYDFIEDDLYLYNKLSAKNILNRIYKILNILSINTSDVEIYYTSRDFVSDNNADEDNEDDGFIEIEEYGIDDKKLNNYNQIKNNYTGVIDPIISLTFDKNKILYNIRTKDKTIFLYKFGEASEKVISDGNEVDHINKFLDIVNDRTNLCKEILYFNDGYRFEEKDIDNDEFEDYVKELYMNYYGVDEDDLYVNEFDAYYDNIKKILTDKFSDGFRLNDNIDLNKFKEEYKSLFKDEIIDENTIEFNEYLCDKFIEIDDEIYAKEALITNEIKTKVDDFIYSIINENVLIPRINNDKEYVLTLDYFFDATNLRTKLSKDKLIKCIEYGLFDEENLDISICYQKEDVIYLMIAFDDRLVGSMDRIKKRDLKECIDDIIANYLRQQGICITLKEIYGKFDYLRSEDIYSIVSGYNNEKSDRVIYDKTGSNTSPVEKKYFHIDSFPFNIEQCRQIYELLKEKENEGWKPVDLKKCIKNNFSSFSYLLSDDDFHSYAIERCINILLDNNENNGNIYDDNEMPDDFIIEDENTYDCLKTGKLAFYLIKYLLENNKLTNEEIAELKTKEFARNNFDGCTYPIIADSYEAYMGDSSTHRYYKTPVIFDDVEYYITSQWYDEGRDDIIKFYKNHNV